MNTNIRDMDQELKQYLDEQFANVVHKNDLSEFATKNDLRTIKTQLDAMQVTLERVDRRDLEDSNVFAKISVQHEERITKVEKDVNELKLRQAS